MGSGQARDLQVELHLWGTEADCASKWNKSAAPDMLFSTTTRRSWRSTRTRIEASVELVMRREGFAWPQLVISSAIRESSSIASSPASRDAQRTVRTPSRIESGPRPKHAVARVVQKRRRSQVNDIESSRKAASS